MAKLSKGTKETIKTIIFLVIVIILILIFIVYPLNRTKAMLGRADMDEFYDNYNLDTLPLNDFTLWTEAGFTPDSFRVESDGLTSLAGLFLKPFHLEQDTIPVQDSVKATIILIHKDYQNRDSLINLTRILTDSGYSVVVYDQRSCGLSTGKYYSDGQYEAADLVSIISYLELRELITHPLVLVGFERGAEATLLAAGEEKRINAALAFNPYLSTDRMLDILKDRFDTYWFPLYKTIMYWWYEIRSGYASPYREAEDIKAVACPTLMFIPADQMEDEEVLKIKELSSADSLTIKEAPDEMDAVISEILNYLSSHPDAEDSLGEEEK